jgi:hypothetical protein
MVFVKPKVSVIKNHAQNSGPKFRLLIPDWIRKKIDSDFWSPGRICDLLIFFSGLFGAWTQNFLASKSTTETNGPSGQLIWAKKCRSFVTCHSLANASNVLRKITKFRIIFYIYKFYQKQNFGDIETDSNVSLISPETSVQLESFDKFFKTKCFGSENPKFWITVYIIGRRR